MFRYRLWFPLIPCVGAFIVSHQQIKRNDLSLCLLKIISSQWKINFMYSMWYSQIFDSPLNLFCCYFCCYYRREFKMNVEFLKLWRFFESILTDWLVYVLNRLWWNIVFFVWFMCEVIKLASPRIWFQSLTLTDSKNKRPDHNVWS